MSIVWECKEKIILSDPSYKKSYSEEKGEWSLSLSMPARSGTWTFEPTIGEILDWGTRVQSFVTYHEGNKDTQGVEKEFTIAVDSGQMSVVDYSSYPDGDDTGTYEDPNSFYGQCCALTKEYYAHELANSIGVVSSSGIGDGMYKGTTTADKNGKVFRIELNFMRENLPRAADLERDD